MTLTSNPATTSKKNADRMIAVWLLAMCAIIAVMVIVGGATRLTDSGLSITEWRPVTGTVPPMSAEAWEAEFAKYKTIPEYTEVNAGMSLDQFKEIYWWEWGHRFLGRLIGIAFLIPFIFFVVTGKARGSLVWKLGGLFILGGLQGALGWWMVSSGLADRVDVSQYRLAAHLGLAVLLFAAMLWMALDLWPSEKIEGVQKFFPVALLLAGAVYLQMILGAFVAGLRAGHVFNTWPLMDGKFFPDGYFSATPGFADLFETMAAVQFNHRIGAYLLIAAAIWFFLAVRKTALKDRASLVLHAIAVQIFLGVITVVAATPIGLGLLHQAGALVLLSTALYAAHGAKG